MVNKAISILTSSLFTILAFTSPVLSLDQPQLVKDINALPQTPDYGPGKVIGTKLVFAKFDEQFGYEPFVMDLTNGSTTLLKDIQPGTDGAGFSEPAVISGSKIVFVSCNTDFGCEPWVTDGTPAGTQLLKDIISGPSGSNPTGFSSTANGHVFFIASTDANGYEPWITDGTTLNTSQIADLNPGSAGSNPNSIKSSMDFVFFSADNGTSGFEPYYYNAMTGSIISLGDINPGNNGSNPYEFSFSGIVLFFSADNGTSGYEPYVSNGVAGNFTSLGDLSPGNLGSNPYNFALVGGQVLFVTQDSSTFVPALWKTNGTAVGTTKVVDLPLFADGQSFAVLGSQYIFTVGSGTQLWVSTGTAPSTKEIVDIIPSSLNSPQISDLKQVGTHVTFFATTPDQGREPWTTDGTAVGTTIIRNMVSGDFPSNPQFLDNNGGNVYFGSFSGSLASLDYGIFATDGAINNVNLKGSLPPSAATSGSSINNMTSFGAKIFFTATDGVFGNEPWISDGTEAGTFILKDLEPGYSSSSVSTPISTLNRVFFKLSNSISGSELYSTDSTSAGTSLLSDIEAGSSSSSPTLFTGGALSNNLFFSASKTGFGRELYKSDGTSGGTGLAAELRAGATSGVGTNAGIVVGSTIYFGGSLNNTTGTELLKSDGSLAGTSLVKDIRSGASASTPRDFVAFGSRILFTADTGSGVGGTGRELWISDGTDAGTTIVKDIRTGTSSVTISHLTVLGALAFFSASDGVNGTELWRTDGTDAGTFMVADLNAGSGSSSPNNVTVFGNKIVFTATTSTTGRELWISDGTPAGTVLVVDLKPGSSSGLSSTAGTLAVLDPFIFFRGTTDASGSELWASNGTAAGTFQVTDIKPGVTGSSIADLLPLNGTLFFTANHPTAGNELFKLVVDKCLSDVSKLEPGICGCGVADVDVNANGQADCLDAPPGFIPVVPKIKLGKNSLVTLTAEPVAGATSYEFVLTYKEGKKTKTLKYKSATLVVKKRIKRIRRGTVVTYKVRAIIGNTFTAFSKAKKFKMK